MGLVAGVFIMSVRRKELRKRELHALMRVKKGRVIDGYMGKSLRVND